MKTSQILAIPWWVPGPQLDRIHEFSCLYWKLLNIYHLGAMLDTRSKYRPKLFHILKIKEGTTQT